MSAEDGGGEKDPKSTRQKVGEGIRQGIGVLSAFKDALEETIQEARDRGDLSTERAKEVMKGALGRAQAAAAEARERLDLVNQGDLDAVHGALDSLKQRIGALEKSVFGESPDAEEGPPEP